MFRLTSLGRVHRQCAKRVAWTALGIGGLALASLLARPSGAASASAFALAHRALGYKQNPVSLAAFNISTRNLADTLSKHFNLTITPQTVLDAARAGSASSTTSCTG